MMALAEVPEDMPNYAREVARLTGTETRTYMALPVQAGGRTLGVSTYINRPGDPPFTPYTPDEAARAQVFAAALGVLLRYHEHTRLARPTLPHPRRRQGIPGRRRKTSRVRPTGRRG